MDSNPSRPPSVDSINLGSAYSGFFPNVNNAVSTNSSQYPQHLHQFANNIPYHSNQYPVQYHNQVQPSVPYQQSNILVQQPTTLQQPYAAPQYSADQPNLSYHYSVSASAAAAAYVNFQQTQQQQQNRHFQPIDPQQPTSYLPPVQWTQSNQYAPGSYATTRAQARVAPNQTYNEYYSQYYLEYYRQLMAYERKQQQAQVRKKTPLKYGSSLVHARAAFSYFDNKLLIVEPNSRIAIYNLQEIFTEVCYPHLFLQTLLNEQTQSESLSGDSKNTSTTYTKTLLPFTDCLVALDWIRIKLLNDTNINYELKLILKVITMLFRQNGIVSGLDLSELLFELVSNGNAETSDVNSAEKMSQTGSGELWKEQQLTPLRQMLMRGQRRVAITYAQNNGLFDHAIALAYLTTFPSSYGTSSVDNSLILSTIRKFITTSLSTTDPLFVYYSHLLQIAINMVNSNTSNADTGISSQTLNAKIDSLESFIILVANEIKFDKVEIANNSWRNLIDLMIALLKHDCDYVLPDELFHDRFDCLLVNECLEFARFAEAKQNSKLIFRRFEFAMELFDFGFINHSVNYCKKILSKFSEDDFDVTEFVQKLKQSSLNASPFAQFLLPLNKDSEVDDQQFLKEIWLYQINKIFSRHCQEEEQFDSPLIKQLTEVSTNQEEESEDVSKEEPSLEELDDEETTAEDISESSQVREEKVEEKKQPLTQNSVDKESENFKTNDEPASNLSVSYTNDKQVNSTLLNDTPGTTPVLERSATVRDKIPNPTTNGRESLPFSPINQQDKSINLERQIPLRESKITSNFDFNKEVVLNSPSMPSEQNNQVNNSFLEQKPPSNVSIQQSSNMSNSFNLSQPFSTTQQFNAEQEALKQPITQPLFTSKSHSFDYNSKDSFQMDPMRNSLPSNVDNTDSANNVQKYQQTFDPNTPPAIDSSAYSSSFDFISTNGHVSSIPTYDPILKNDTDASNPNANLQYSNHNNEFLQNYKPTSNSQLTTNSAVNKDVSNSDSTKNSPSKVNNGGLFTALFGRLRPKNQAILPDDTDPTLVFDPVTKRWVDKTSGDSGSQEIGPPPPPKIPFNNSPALPSGQNKTEPNSLLTSPHDVQTVPTIPMFSSPPMSPTNDTQRQPNLPTVPSMVPNGISPFNVPTPQMPAGGNAFRGVSGGIRKNRYIDVFNPPNKS